VSSKRNNFSSVLISKFILNSDLNFSIRSHPRTDIFNSALNESLDQFITHMMRKRHIFRSFISGVTNHESLISGTLIVFGFINMDWIGDLYRLFIKSDHNSCVFIVKTFGDIIISDIFDSISNNLFKDDIGFGGNFSENNT